MLSAQSVVLSQGFRRGERASIEKNMKKRCISAAGSLISGLDGFRGKRMRRRTGSPGKPTRTVCTPVRPELRLPEGNLSGQATTFPTIHLRPGEDSWASHFFVLGPMGRVLLAVWTPFLEVHVRHDRHLKGLEGFEQQPSAKVKTKVKYHGRVLWATVEAGSARLS